MIEICEYAVHAGKKGGADEVEAVWSRDTVTTVEAEMGEISAASRACTEGIRIRVIKDRSVGSVYTYRMEEKSVDNAVRKAVGVAQVSPEDPHWNSLPSPGNYNQLYLWDPRIVKASPEDLMNPVAELFQSIPDGVRVHSVGSETVVKERYCVNTHGVAHHDKGTLQRYGIVAVGKMQEEITPAFREMVLSRTLDVRIQEKVEMLWEKIRLFRDSESASSGIYPVVFSPRALQEILYYTLFRAVSGENVANGKSLLKGAEGKRVADSVFSLHDNGIISRGINSREMDDEGVPCQDTSVIEEGILQGFIWNDYWAKRTGHISTGNAHYETRTSALAVQPTNMVITPGDCSERELLEIQDGYYILDIQGAHASNPESGDFSVLCNPAYRIRNGEITGGCTGMMISDNVFSLIKKIDAVGRETTAVNVGIFPSIRFREVNVAAGGE
jgi:PmbA protein